MRGGSKNVRNVRAYLARLAGCILAMLIAVVGGPGAWAQAAKGSPNAAAKRYASLKSDRVTMRQGPGADFAAAGVFQRLGLPVEIVQENEGWSQVRDAGGTVGWVHGSLLSRRRTALILPWEVKDGQTQAASAILREDDSESARPVAQVEAGVLATIVTCEGGWCRVAVGAYRGYIERAKLWGTFPNEEIK